MPQEKQHEDSLQLGKWSNLYPDHPEFWIFTVIVALTLTALFVVGVLGALLLSFAVSAAIFFGGLSLLSAYYAFKQAFHDEGKFKPLLILHTIAGVFMEIVNNTLGIEDAADDDGSHIFRFWWGKFIFKISATLTLLILAVFPILMVTGVLPVSMLGIVAFGGFGAVAASLGFLVALPLLATVIFYLLQYDKEGGWLQKPANFLRDLIASHKTQIVFWALATTVAAVLFTLFLPPLAIPGLTATTTLALIIVGASVGIAIGELVTLTGIVNVVARWVLALVADKSQGQPTPTENASTVKNTSTLAYAAAAITGAPTKDYEQIRENNFHCSGRTFFIPVAGPEPAGDSQHKYGPMPSAGDPL